MKQSTTSLMFLGSIREFVVEGKGMVYCTKCGTDNAEDATGCVSCGASLHLSTGEGKTLIRYGRYEGESGFLMIDKHVMAILIGLVILFVGFCLLMAEIYFINIPWGPILLILAGVFILVRFFRVRKHR